MNPNHDRLGRFASAPGGSGVKIEDENEKIEEFDLGNIDSFLGSITSITESEKKPVEYKECETVEEANKLADEIFGQSGVAIYDSEKVKTANLINKALIDVKNDFPEAISGITRITNDIHGFFALKPVIEKQWRDAIVEYYKEAMPEKWNSYDDHKKEIMINFQIDLLRKNKKANPLLKSYWMGSNFIVGGVTNKSLRFVTINPFTDEEMINKTFGDGKNGIEWTCYHELGHVVSNTFLEKLNQEENNKLKSIFYKASTENHTTIYGATSINEFISEAFADVYINKDKARSFHKEIYKYAKEWYGKYIKENKNESSE